MEKPNIFHGILHESEIQQIPMPVKTKLEDFLTCKIEEALTSKALHSAKIQDAGM